MVSNNKTEKFLNNFLLIALVLGLFAIGGHILTLKIPFWSLFLGIASIQVGIVLSIFTFDIISRRASKTITEEYQAIPCLVCKTMTYVPKYKKTTICDNCQVRIASVAKPLIVVFVALLSLASVTYMVGFRQDIRRQASETNVIYTCEQGSFIPSACRCGIDRQEICSLGEISRECSDGKNYCCTVENNGTIIWNCEETR